MTYSSEQDRTFREEAIPQMEAVYRFALRLTADSEDAQDLVQETYLRAYRSWGQYSQGTQVKSWLFTICKNSFLRGSERTRRHEEIMTAVAAEDPSSVSRESAVFMEAASRGAQSSFWREVVDTEVLRAIDALPQEFREAVVLSDLEDLSYQEIATITGVPIGTVRSRLFRGRRVLEKQLYDYGVAEGIVPLRTPTLSNIEERREANELDG
jgi:RNA polymerase sigma-70 factor (ECF subfamily)